MLRGEVWWVRFGSAQGGEIQKERPAIIISADASNQALNRLQVIPITTNTGRLFPSEAYITVNGQRQKAMTDQLTTVSKERLSNQGGRISTSELKQLEQALKVQLGMR